MENPIIPTGDIFSKRQKRFRGEVPDVYVYDSLPDPLRQQICYILDHAFDDCLQSQHPKLQWDKKQGHYEDIAKILRDEHGVRQLSEPDTNSPGLRHQKELENFLLENINVEKTIDAIEVSFRFLEEFIRLVYSKNTSFEKVERKLNFRFKEHGVGYQFTDKKIIRIDSELIHSEIVQPALKLLRQPHYEGAQDEFLKAHRHYQKGNTKEALNECLKAFESVMKIICRKRGWHHDSNATARRLIQACFDNGLIPTFWESHYSSLRSLLECSVPTARNRQGAHGQGPTPITVPNHIVAYMLHMTASAIVFLAEAERSL